MTKLHVFIDGTWLFKACEPGRAMSYRQEHRDKPFRLDFNKLCEALLDHVVASGNTRPEIGDRLFCASIFDVPADIDAWVGTEPEFTESKIGFLKNAVEARNGFVNDALRANFLDRCISRPKLKTWICREYLHNEYQEKRVDTMVVAEVVRSAHTHPQDYHCILSGDDDVLPALMIDYPRPANIFIAATDPNHQHLEARQTAHSLFKFKWQIQPFVLDKHAKELLAGDHIYACEKCNAVFARDKPIPREAPPCCTPCFYGEQERRLRVVTNTR